MTIGDIYPLNRRVRPAKPEESDRERANMFVSGIAGQLAGEPGYDPCGAIRVVNKLGIEGPLASLLAEVRVEERERVDAILQVLLDDLAIGEQYDKPGGMKPTCHPPLSRMLPTHRNHIRRMITAIRGMK